MNTALNGTNCTAPFRYQIGATDDAVTDVTLGIWRNCYFCNGDGTNSWVITNFTLPSTGDRLVTGISMWTSDTSGATYLKKSVDKTLTKFVGDDIKAN